MKRDAVAFLTTLNELLYGFSVHCNIKKNAEGNRLMCGEEMQEWHRKNGFNDYGGSNKHQKPRARAKKGDGGAKKPRAKKPALTK